MLGENTTLTNYHSPTAWICSRHVQRILTLFFSLAAAQQRNTATLVWFSPSEKTTEYHVIRSNIKLKPSVTGFILSV